MRTVLLLSLCALTLAMESRGVWDLLGGLISTEGTNVPEDARLNIQQLAHKYGYNLEEHIVTTEDGYILNVHRMPQGIKGKKNGPAVLLMHGILECSDSWLLQGPNYSLAYVLADEGFDVWMGNARGNKHSLEHTTMNMTSSEYWKFTWEEIGRYDLSATIDYMLEISGKENLYYIGHSQGTTVGYVLLSMKPEYNEKIKIMFSLAPEAWMGNVKSPVIKLFSPTFSFLSSLLLEFNPYTVGTDLFNKVSPFVCGLLPWNCDNILYAMSGYESKINASLLPVIFGHMPTGSSTLQFVHYGQLVNSKRFCRYDYGHHRNIEVYNQLEPPDYDVGNIIVPNVLFYSGKDWLSHPDDVDILKRRLHDVFAYVYVGDFTHLDYVYAADARDAIYERIIAQISKFEIFGVSNDVPKSFRKYHGRRLIKP